MVTNQGYIKVNNILKCYEWILIIMFSEATLTSG